MEKNYFSAIEFGSLFNNVLVMSYNNDKLDVVAALKVPSKGFLNGEIINDDEFDNSIKFLIQQVCSLYKIKIDEAILVVPNNSHNIKATALGFNILTEKHIIGKVQIDSIKNQVMKVPILDEEMIIKQVPTMFELDNGRMYRTEPLGISSSTLKINSILHTLPKRIVLPLNESLKNNNVRVLSNELCCHCGAYGVSSDFELEGQCIHINIGQDATTLSAFSKNIIVGKTIQLNFGFASLVTFLARTLNVSFDFAQDLIESYFICNNDYASDVIFDENFKLSEKRISGIVLNRLYNAFSEIVEAYNTLLDEVKFESNCKVLLTGCLNDYEFFVEEFSKNTQLNVIEGNIDVVGITDQTFVNCYGAIVNFIRENKDLIVSRFEEMINVSDIKSQDSYENNETKKENPVNAGKFRDIFDD